jgi:hypothetical protein
MSLRPGIPFDRASELHVITARCGTVSILLAVVALAGCQRIVEVTGTVRIDGKPAKGVIVVFDPASPDKPRGVASTDQDGVYKLRRLGPGSKPGVPTGMYSVKLMPDVDSPGVSRIPEKFSQSSQLSRDVTGPSPHSYDIEISTR